MNTVVNISPGPPAYFEIRESVAFFRPVGDISLEDGVNLVDDAIQYCRSQRISCLLVNTWGLSGFEPPSLADRFWLVSRWAETSRGRVVLSIVAPGEMILPDKIGITMARNRGLCTDVFTEESEAIEWLRAECK